MRFVKEEVNTTPIEDTVFAIVKKAKAAIAELGEDKVINATIGSLYDEDEKLVAFESVLDVYKRQRMHPAFLIHWTWHFEVPGQDPYAGTAAELPACRSIPRDAVSYTHLSYFKAIKKHLIRIRTGVQSKFSDR